MLKSRAFLTLLIFILLALVSCARPRPADRPREVVQVSGKTFALRVSEFPEVNGGFVTGAYYRFESLPFNSKAWVTAMEFRHDDPVPIPKENLRFLTTTTAFMFMGWKYAVTTDGGKNWRVWSADSDLAGWSCCNYSLIKDIVLSPDGAGRMFLSPIEGRAGEVRELVTSDFGAHWTLPQQLTKN